MRYAWVARAGQRGGDLEAARICARHALARTMLVREYDSRRHFVVLRCARTVLRQVRTPASAESGEPAERQHALRGALSGEPFAHGAAGSRHGHVLDVE